MSFFVTQVWHTAVYFTASQSCWGWQRPLEIMQSNPLLKQGQEELVAQSCALGVGWEGS